MRNMMLLLASTAMLTACQQAGYNNNPNTYKGAAIGGVLGGTAGAVSGDNSNERLKRGAIGAGVGALAGAAIGQYMDRQEAEMRQQLQGTDVQVKRQGNDLFLNMPNNITFGFDSTVIRPEFVPTLNNIADVLKNYPQTMVEVIGHTDSTGSNEYNQGLSERRARAVAAKLQARGVAQRIMVIGQGETQPIATNDTEAGRAQNRRVEVKISPITQ